MFFFNSLILKGGEGVSVRTWIGRKDVICKVIRNIIILQLANKMHFRI